MGDAEKRGQLIRHLEHALAHADELEDGHIASCFMHAEPWSASFMPLARRSVTEALSFCATGFAKIAKRIDQSTMGHLA
jgi:hypothetical protein